MRERGTGFADARLGDDIDVISLLHDLVFTQLQLAVGNALAGLHVVFVAMPGTDEMTLAVGEIQPARRLVGQDALFDLGDDQTLAGGPALVNAKIAVGVELSVVPEHADLVIAEKNDAAVAVLELRSLADEFFRHPSVFPVFWFVSRRSADLRTQAVPG